MQTPVDSPFDKTSTSEDVVGSLDLSGKLVVITGGSQGIGKATARAMANAGADVFIGALADQLDTAHRELEASTIGKIYAAELDLAEPASVDEFADAVLALNRPVNVLINNAGTMALELTQNSLGIELTLAVNYVGHAILTSRLAPALIAAGESRLVSVASTGHHYSTVVLDDLNYEHREFDKIDSYGQSKTGVVLLTVKAAKELGAKGVTASAIHPGNILTELMRSMPPEELDKLLAELATMQERVGVELYMKSPSQGAATSVWAATSAALKDKGPLYLEDCHVAPMIEEPNYTYGVLAYALDEKLADDLWKKTEAMLNRPLPL